MGRTNSVTNSPTSKAFFQKTVPFMFSTSLDTKIFADSTSSAVVMVLFLYINIKPVYYVTNTHAIIYNSLESNVIFSYRWGLGDLQILYMISQNLHPSFLVPSLLSLHP